MPIPVKIPVVDVLADEMRTSAAVNTLLQKQLLLVHDIKQSFLIHPDAARQLSKERNSEHWKVVALAAVCRAFPRWSVPASV